MGGGHDERGADPEPAAGGDGRLRRQRRNHCDGGHHRVDILDPAILRPGRFDRTVAVGAPDVKGREEILRVHSKASRWAMMWICSRSRRQRRIHRRGTENLLNEAAIHAAKEQRAYLTQADIQKAFIKVGIGTEKKSRVISQEEKRITAYHEAGHAILFHVLDQMSRYIPFPLFPPVWEPRDTPCRCPARTRCSIPGERCWSTFRCAWAAVLRRN